ncbi:NUDIX domain-containing protein [Bradyrhizobium sp. SSBR45G]|nr:MULTISPECIES: NUDIX domain-containing protein [unclassified Bradyrhizobium]
MNEPRLGCGVVIVDGEAILLVRRLHDPEAGCWGLPGRKVDWLEPVEDAVRREATEELDITLGDLRLICVVDQIDRLRGEHWVAPVYLAAGFKGEPRLVEPDKHAAFGWFALHGLPTPLTLATQQAVHAPSRGR